MIVYRVAQGKGWTANTLAEVTTRGSGDAIRLGTFRAAAGSSTFAESEGPIKSRDIRAQSVPEVYKRQMSDDVESA